MVQVLLSVFIFFACGGAVTVAYGYWSQEWTQNYPPEAVGAFTKMEFFIMPDSPSGVTFAAATLISPAPGSSKGWTSVLPNTKYSLLTGPLADTACITTYFSSLPSVKFDLDFVLWKGNTVVERQEFKWLGNAWDNPNGTILSNIPGTYDRADPPPVPIPSTILLLMPACLGVFLLKRCIGQR
jgi:hypothetical protein